MLPVPDGLEDGGYQDLQANEGQNAIARRAIVSLPRQLLLCFPQAQHR
jgi:hypothetical protein